MSFFLFFFFFFQAEDGIRDGHVTGVQTCALPISKIYDKPQRVRVLVAWAWPFFLAREWWHGCWRAPGLALPIQTTPAGVRPLPHLCRMSFAVKSSWYWQQWPSSRRRRFIHEHRN